MRKTFCYIGTMLIVLLYMRPTHATGLNAVGTSAPVHVKEVQIDIEVRGVYVSAVMEVAFEADSGDTNTGNLRFPLPPGSVLHGAEIFLPSQERWERAETIGRRQGQAVFEEVIQESPETDALLIQRIGTDFYRARVSPINAAGDLRLRIRYAHVLERTKNGHTLRIAFANPDATPSTPSGSVSITIVTDADFWLEAAWSGLEENAAPPPVDLTHGVGVLTLNDFRMDRDILLEITPAVGAIDLAALVYRSDDDEIQDHVHAWWRPDFADYPDVFAQPRNVVFVIDRSGSMSGQKMSQTRQVIVRLINELSSNDYYGIVAFDSTPMIFRREMTSGDDKSDASQWVSSLSAGSSTGMSAGLVAGARIGVTSPLDTAAIDLLLITDGRPNEGSTTLEGILADVMSVTKMLERDVRIFSVGIGQDLDDTLLRGLAQSTGGEATFALDDSEITGQVTDLFARIRSGGVADLTISLNPDSVQSADSGSTLATDTFAWPRVFSGASFHLGAMGALGPTVELRLTGTAPDLSPVVLTAFVAPPREGSNSIRRIVPPLVAKARADRLEREIDILGETSERVQNAVALARIYGILTRYSSLVALDSDELYAQKGIERPKRDEAGISLTLLTSIGGDESRIGGQGTEDSPVASTDGAIDAATSATGAGATGPVATDSAATGAGATGSGATAGGVQTEVGVAETDVVVADVVIGDSATAGGVQASVEVGEAEVVFSEPDVFDAGVAVVQGDTATTASAGSTGSVVTSVTGVNGVNGVTGTTPTGVTTGGGVTSGDDDTGVNGVTEQQAPSFSGTLYCPLYATQVFDTLLAIYNTGNSPIDVTLEIEGGQTVTIGEMAAGVAVLKVLGGEMAAGAAILKVFDEFGVTPGMGGFKLVYTSSAASSVVAEAWLVGPTSVIRTPVSSALTSSSTGSLAFGGPGLLTYVSVYNVGSEDQTASVDVGGSSTSRMVKAGESELFTGGGSTFAPITVSGLDMYVVGSWVVNTDDFSNYTVGATSSGGRTLRGAYFITGGGADTFLAIANTGSSTVIVSSSAFASDKSVQPGETEFVSLSQEGNSGHGGIELTASGGSIVADAWIQLGSSIFWVPVSSVSSSSHGAMWIEIGEYESFIAIYNPGSSSVSATISYTGSAASQSQDVAAGSAELVPVNSLGVGAYSVTGGSVVVTGWVTFPGGVFSVSGQ